MSGCCDSRAYDEEFGRFAHRVADRYRRRGLDRTEQVVVEEVVASGVVGATVLDIGGGVGQLSVELLHRGAASATCVELTSVYDAEAASIASRAGVADRMTRRRVDVATDPGAVGAADVVLLNKVVCCYPDQAALLGSAAELARRLLVLSYPRVNAVTRAAGVVENWFHKITGAGFRAAVHAEDDLFATLTRHGLTPRVVSRGLLWQVAVAVRGK